VSQKKKNARTRESEVNHLQLELVLSLLFELQHKLLSRLTKESQLLQLVYHTDRNEQVVTMLNQTVSSLLRKNVWVPVCVYVE